MPARLYLAVLLVSGALAFSAVAAPAAAFNPLKPLCSAAGLLSGLAGKACTVIQHSGRLLDASKKLVTGNLTGAAKTLLGDGGSKVASMATTALALGALVSWAVGGAGFVLHETATVIGQTTKPQLTTTWFSATYWQIAGIAAVLTLPFLFAAAVQALLHSDITLLVRAALGYLPLAMLAVAVAAPMTMLLLSASDQLAAIVSLGPANQTARFLNHETAVVGALTHLGVSQFVGFLIALLTVGAGLGLWIELMMRAAAIYVVVLMLPLAFAAFVWPARRVWVVRAVELLLALIVSKFVIVAVLALGGAALSDSANRSITGMLAGLVLIVLATFSPWALLRLLPVTEIATAAAGSLRHETRAAVGGADRASAWADEAETWAAKAAEMRREADASETVDAAGAAKEGLVPQNPTIPAEEPEVTPAGAAAGVAVAVDAGAVAAHATSADGAQASSSNGAAAERLPGLPERWQAANGTWNPLILGSEKSSVWPPDDPGALDHGTAAAPAPVDHGDGLPPRDQRDGLL